MMKLKWINLKKEQKQIQPVLIFETDNSGHESRAYPIEDKP
jgi:hypothetical protein